MTKRQRAQVVELLRCAADCKSLTTAGYALGYCDGKNPCLPVFALACEAYTHIHKIPTHWYWARPQKSLLEAAARVEEGSYP